jgi:tetratricopeptide (TPR) repeat protein
LEENLKRTMQVASVIGREFSCRILSALNEMRQDLKGSLLSLQGLGFIYERQLFPELEYVFKHALTHEVAYNSLLLKRRRELHEKIGEAIEQIYADRLEEYYELLAYHYVQSNNKQKAIEYLDLANQKAATANAVEDAKGYFDKAMELLDTLPETEENRQRRISLLVNQSNVFFLLLKYPEYYDLLISNEPLAAGLDNPGSVGAFYTRLGWSESIFGHFDQAIQTLSKATRLSEPAGNLEETGFSLFFLAYTHLMKSDYDRVFELQEHLLRTMKESFNLRCFVRGLTSASQAYAHLGRWDEAVEAGEKALRSAQDYLDASMIAFAEVSLSAVHTYKRDMGRAIECAQLALERARTPADRLMGQQFLAWALCHGGEPHKGIEILAGILPLYQAVGFIMNELWCASFLADGYWLAGEYDKGRQTAEKLLGIAQGRGARYCIGYAYRILGEIALNNSPEESAPHFEKAISIFHEIKAENELALDYSGMGRYHKQQGNAKQAREYLTKALEIFERLGTLLEPDKVRRELGELPQ